MSSNNTSQQQPQKPSLSLFLDRVTAGISRNELLLDSVIRIQEHEGAVWIVAVPKDPELLENLRETLVERIREMPEELGLIFTAKAQENDVGGKPHLIVKLIPGKP